MKLLVQTAQDSQLALHVDHATAQLLLFCSQCVIFRFEIANGAGLCLDYLVAQAGEFIGVGKKAIISVDQVVVLIAPRGIVEHDAVIISGTVKAVEHAIQRKLLP